MRHVVFLFLALLLSPPAAGQGTTLVFHSVESISPHTLPARRLPAGEPGLVNGGLLSGDPDLDKAWAALLPAGGWQVVNLGGRDLAGLAGGLAALQGAGDTAVVSANVLWQGRPAGKAFQILQLGGRKVAFTGVAAPPPGGRLPAGVTLADPGKALEPLLPRLGREADLVVVLAAMDREGAARLLRRVPGIDLCLASGRTSGDPEPLVLGGARLVLSPTGGRLEGRTAVTLDEAGKVAALDHRFAPPAGTTDPAVAAARRRSGLVTDPVTELPLAEPPPLPGEEGILPPVANRACRFAVKDLRRCARYGDLPAPAGGALVVLDAALENIMPLTKVRELELPTLYLIPNLADHLYLVAGGRRLCRLAAAGPLPPGHLPVRGFSLERLGSRRRGNLVFALPPGAGDHLELRFYDYAHGHMTLCLTPGNEAPAPAEPKLPAQRNRFLEMGIYETKEKAVGGGMALLTLELRGRSLYEMDGDATAFDPKAKKGERLPVGTVADWSESRRYLQVVVDGEYAFPPLARSGLDPNPRFLPDRMTGGELVFQVPVKRKSLELRCDFPNARAPGAEQTFRPAPLLFLLDGERPEPAPLRPLAAITDPPFQVAFTGQRLYSSWAGSPAGQERKFLALTVTVANTGGKGEFFQPYRQLLYVTEKGRQVAMVETSRLGDRPAFPLLWIPRGQRRSFRALFPIPAADLRPRVAYQGVTLARTESLPPLGDAAVAAGPPAPNPPVPKRPPGEPAPAAPAAGALPGVPLPGFRPARAANEEVELTLLDCRTHGKANTNRAESGKVYLHLKLRWRRLGEGAWKCPSTRNSLYYLRAGRFLQHLRFAYQGHRGFLAERIELANKGDTCQGRIAFTVPSGSRLGDCLLFDGPGAGTLRIPLAPAGPAPPPALAAGGNPVLRMEVLGLEDVTEKTEKPDIRRAWGTNRVCRLRLRVTALETLRLEAWPGWFQVIAGGSLPCRLLTGHLGKSLAWAPLERDAWLPEGVPVYGAVLFSLPDPALGLTAACRFRPVQGRRRTTVEMAPFALSLREGKARPPGRTRAELSGGRFNLRVLGIRRERQRTDRPQVVVDAEVAVPAGGKGMDFELARQVVMVDQAGEEAQPGYYCTRYSPAPWFHLAPGEPRRFEISFILHDPGSRLWFYAPGANPRQEVVIPNPWVKEEREFAGSGKPLSITEFDKTRKHKGEGNPRYEPPPLRPEPKPRGLAGAGVSPKAVNEAIRKGALYLIRFLQRKGYDLNQDEHALAALALLHTEELARHPAFRARTVDFLLRRRLDQVYDAALTIMGLTAVDAVRYRPRIRRIAQMLVDRQSPTGGWGYLEKFCRAIKPDPALLPPAGERISVQGGEPIPGWPGAEKKPPLTLKVQVPIEHQGGDNSCSQYAVLGLQAAATAGIRAPRETWGRAAKWFLEGHNPGRGWGYGQRGQDTGSMTTAGLAGLAVARFHLGGADPAAEQALRCGVDWLGRNFLLAANPCKSNYHHYYLYGLERAGRLLDKDFLGTREWYPEGAKYLVGVQAGDGSWSSPFEQEPFLDTSYALLFLTKATEKLGEKAVRTGPGRLLVKGAGMGGTVDFILDASGSMRARLGDGGKSRFEVARQVVHQVLEGSGKGLTVGLRVYGHRYRANKKEADRDSELLVDFGPANRPELFKALARLRCRGKTPLTFSIEEALKELARAPGRTKRIVLLTDGYESDRRARPTKAAAKAKAAGVQLDVVCFAMEDPSLLEKVAAAGGGTCYSARDGEQLLAAVQTAMLGRLNYRVLDPAGKEVARGGSGKEIQLPAGPYLVELALPEGARKVAAWIHQDRLTTILVTPGSDHTK